jgi:phospho-N-acetylmuramoyl-pentapeptide-transferase
MLYSLLTSLTENYSFLNVFKYITFRTGLSVVTSFMIVFIIGEPLIKIFKKNQVSGPIRQDGPIHHIIKKSGTPTMGGLIIILGIFLGTFLWADLSNVYILTVIFVSIGLGFLGFIDDLLKIKLKNSRGLNSKLKLLGQIIVSIIAIYILSEYSEHQFLNNLYFPFFKNLILPMGIFFIPFALFVIV